VLARELAVLKFDPYSESMLILFCRNHPYEFCTAMQDALPLGKSLSAG
jgi:hypothetical protein